MEDRLRLSFIDMYGECPDPIFLNSFNKELRLLKSSGCMDKLCAIAEEFEQLIDTRWPSYLPENEGSSIILNMLGIMRSRYGSCSTVDSERQNGQFLTGRPYLPMDLRTGEVTLLVGRPGTGKTDMACRAADLVMNEGRKVLYFAMDDDIDSLKSKMCFTNSEIAPADVIFDPSRELTVLYQHYGYDYPSSPDVMLERFEQMSSLHFGIGLIVIDFMQMFSYTHSTMRRLKELAERTRCHIFATSSVSRASEGRLPRRQDIDPALLDGPDQIFGLYRTWGDLGSDSEEPPTSGVVV